MNADNADATCCISYLLILFTCIFLAVRTFPSKHQMASPPSADFSFTAPFPALKQRRVSLALPASTPRVPWSFRDDTGLAGPSSAQQQPPSPTKEPKKGKIRKTEPLDPAAPVLEKKPRKKWSPEETQMLVEGCNRVRIIIPSGSLFPDNLNDNLNSTASVTGRLF